MTGNYAIQYSNSGLKKRGQSRYFVPAHHQPGEAFRAAIEQLLDGGACHLVDGFQGADLNPAICAASTCRLPDRRNRRSKKFSGF
jgi:hypothetical protein